MATDVDEKAIKGPRKRPGMEVGMALIPQSVAVATSRGYRKICNMPERVLRMIASLLETRLSLERDTASGSNDR